MITSVRHPRFEKSIHYEKIFVNPVKNRTQTAFAISNGVNPIVILAEEPESMSFPQRPKVRVRGRESISIV